MLRDMRMRGSVISERDAGGDDAERHDNERMSDQRERRGWR
jgi:hypothetical protein